MNLRFLLDSNILSEPLRPQPNTKVMEKLLEPSESPQKENFLSHH